MVIEIAAAKQRMAQMRMVIGKPFGEDCTPPRTERRSTLNRGFGSWEDHTHNLDTEACLGARKSRKRIRARPLANLRLTTVTGEISYAHRESARLSDFRSRLKTRNRDFSPIDC
jgi:hypothetical protein